MRTMIQKVLFGLVMAAGLSFGAAQATAAPAAVAEVRACTASICSGDCIRRGYELGGRCLDGECVCWDDAR